MELRQLEYVVAVVDQGGFTRAAASIPVSQPSLSQGVRSLEAELGAPLFHRLGRQVRLTAAGEALLAPARQALRDTATAVEAVRAVSGLQAGHLDVVALPTLAVDPLAALLGRFRQAHPGVQVRLSEPEEAGAAPAQVRDGEADLGLVDLPVDPALGDIPLGEQEVLAVFPPQTDVGARVSITRLARWPLVATPPGTSTRQLIDDAFARADATADIAVETDHREALLPLVLAGAGVSFLPEPQARRAGDQGAVVARLQPSLRRTIGLIHRDGPLSPAAEAFVALSVPSTEQRERSRGGRRRGAGTSGRPRPTRRSTRR